jgi:hypothetical protein
MPEFASSRSSAMISANFSSFHHKYCPLINIWQCALFKLRMKWNKEQAVRRTWKVEGNMDKAKDID